MQPPFIRHLAAAAVLTLAAGAAWAQASTFSQVGSSHYDADDGLTETLCFDFSATGAAKDCTGSHDFAGSVLSYGATASADYGVLKVMGSSSIARETAAAEPTGGYFSTVATASFRDQWVIGGRPAGSTGTLTLVVDVTGSFGSSGVDTGYSYGLSLWNRNTNVFAIDNRTPSYEGRLTTSFTFGETLDFQVFLIGGSQLYRVDAGGRDGQSSFMNMANTAVVTALVVQDSGGNAVSFSLATASGAEHFAALAPVPEPAAAALLLAGLAVTAAATRRRRREAAR